MWATRLWWMLHWAGHKNVTLLDGGYTGWIAAGLPIDNNPTPYPTSDMTVVPQPGLWATREEVLAAVGDGAVCTINALSPDVYAGTSNTNYGRPGHIPGSKNLYYGSILDGQSFRSADEIAAAVDGVGVRTADRIITYCGGGISATVDAFALKLIGYDNVAVYDGSMSDWVRDPNLPLVTGARPLTLSSGVAILRLALFEKRADALPHVAGLRDENLLTVFHRDDGFQAAGVDAHVETFLRQPDADRRVAENLVRHRAAGREQFVLRHHLRDQADAVRPFGVDEAARSAAIPTPARIRPAAAGNTRRRRRTR